MTSTVSRQQLRRAMYDGRIPGLGFSGVADSVAAGAITDAYALRDSNLGPAQYTGMYIFRPDVAGEDKVRVAGALVVATGVLSHTGQNWSDTTDLDYEIIGLMHPDELNACVQRAMKRVYQEVQLPLAGQVVDGDMELSNVTNWTSIGTPATKEKATAAADVFSGTSALHVVNSGVNEGAQSNTFKCQPSMPFYCSTVVRCASGTAVLQVYDETNAVVLASVETSSDGWVHLWLQSSVPLAGDGETQCETLSVRLVGEETDADLYWNHAVFYFPSQFEHLAPSWLDEQFKFLKLREAVYRQSTNFTSQTYGGYHDAFSRTWSDWQQPGHYSLDPFHADSNPYKVTLKKAPPNNELWIEAKRPWADTTPLDADDDTTVAPRDHVEAYIKLEIAKVLTKRYPNAKQWVLLLQEAGQDVSAENQARPEVPLRIMPRQQPNRGRI